MQDKLQEQEKSSLQDAQPMPALTDAAALTEAGSLAVALLMLGTR